MKYTYIRGLILKKGMPYGEINSNSVFWFTYLCQKRFKNNWFSFLLIIFLFFMWIRQKLNQNTWPSDGENQALSIYILWKNDLLPILFRCEAYRRRLQDRLLCSLVDQTGNLIFFDELVVKDFVQQINNKKNHSFKEILLRQKSGKIQLILKHRLLKEKSINPHCFEFALKKIEKYLDEIRNQLEALIRVFVRGGIQKKNMRKQRQNQLKLFKNVRNVIEGKENEITPSRTRKDQIKESSRIFQVHEVKLGQKLNKHGGASCQIQKRQVKKFTYINQNDDIVERESKVIGVKTPKTLAYTGQNIEYTREKNEQFQRRFRREKKIVQYIQRRSKKNYLIEYYEDPRNENQTYIQYIDQNLSEFLFCFRESLSLNDLFGIAKQILEIVQDLHEIGVVHRDLKPENMLVKFEETIEIKIIDFSDSCIVGDSQMIRENLYGTFPFSPLQCSTLSTNYQRIGKDSKKIDNWSVGLVLHEIFKGYLPLSYSPCLAKDIQALWSSEFLYIASNKNRRGINNINIGFQVLNLMLVQVNQKKRCSLKKASRILSCLEIYYKELLQISLEKKTKIKPDDNSI